jgi:hypothetical protein
MVRLLVPKAHGRRGRATPSVLVKREAELQEMALRSRSFVTRSNSPWLIVFRFCGKLRRRISGSSRTSQPHSSRTPDVYTNRFA